MTPTDKAYIADTRARLAAGVPTITLEQFRSGDIPPIIASAPPEPADDDYRDYGQPNNEPMPEPAPPPTTEAGPVLEDLADVVRVPITWTWPGRIPSGRITLLSGMPGAGKSFLTTDIAARITCGSPWPDGSGNAPIGSVLFIVAEDNSADTLGPRLDAAGVNPARGRVVRLAMVRRIDPETGKMLEQCFSLDDVVNLETTIQRMTNLRAIVIDPIGSYMGGRVDSHRDNDVRAVLSPVAALAEKYGIAILIVAHVRKAVSNAADDGVLGSRAFTGLARMVWHLSRDKADRDRCLLLPGKCNLAKQPDGMAFTIAGNPPKIIWEREPLKMHADDVCGEAGIPGPEPEARRSAEDWLREVLADGPVPSGDLKNPAPGTIRALAREADFTWITIRRAADHMGVRRERDSYSKVFTWRLLKTGGKPCCSSTPQNEQHEQHEQHEEIPLKTRCNVSPVRDVAHVNESQGECEQHAYAANGEEIAEPDWGQPM